MNTILIFIISIVIGWGIVWIPSLLYLKFGFLSSFFHDILRWHQPKDNERWNDGLSDHSTCRYCGNDIMQDSQGNWFTRWEY